jgi:hypothetical protein
MMIHAIRSSYVWLLAFAVVGTVTVAHAQPHAAGQPHPAAQARPTGQAHPGHSPTAAGSAHAPDAQEAAAPKADGKESDAKEGEPAAAQVPQKLTIDVDFENISKFEVGPATFNAEFVVTTACEHAPCKPEFDLGNGRITGKEKLVDEELLKVTKYKAEVTGFVDLSEFPFDKHVLFLELQEKSDPLNTTLIVDKKDLQVDPRIKLTGWALNPKPEAEVEKQEIGENQHFDSLLYGVEIERPRVAALFKTMVPAVFMVLIMMLTLLLKPKSASARLTASTGALMTLVMFHLSSTSALPPLGYLTRMDKFMIANYFVYLVNIVFAVAIVRLDERKNERGAELAYLTALGAVPGVTLLAWIIVFLRVV